VHQDLNVCTEDAIACDPESLYMFIKLMLGGQSLLKNGLSDGNDDDKEDDDDIINDVINADDDDDEDHDDDHGTDDDLDSNDAVDKEGKQPIRQQNTWVRKQETRVLSITQDPV